MGFAFRDVGEDESAAATLGINAGAYKLAAFGIGTALAGLAGGLYAFFTQFITADAFDFIFSVMLMAMVVIGGRGNLVARRAGKTPSQDRFNLLPIKHDATPPVPA